MEGAEILRVFLAVDVAGMLVLALVYLRRRQLSRQEQLVWGLVALLFPVLGPFLVIASRPGAGRQPRRRRVFAADTRKRT